MNDPSCRDASSTGASSGGGCCGDISRRQLLAAAGLAAGVSAIRSLPRLAGPFENQNEYLQTIPSDKKLDAAWVRSLYERGEKQVYRNSELKYIGMPVGGIGAGMVYLGGDGRGVRLLSHRHQGHSRIPGRRAGRGGTRGQFARQRSGRDIAEKDGATGTLTSRPFKIERRWICFRIGGGHHADTAVRLVIGGETVREERGRDRNAMHVAAMDVAGLEGREARLVLVDQVSGGWGNLGVDHIVFTDTRPEELPFEHRPDFGTFALALMGRADFASAALDPGQPLARAEPEAVGPAGEPLAGVLAQRVELPAGGEEVVTFVFAWHMPNLELSHLGRPGRWYASRFPDAAAVAEHLAEHLESLVGRTRRWVATWYDSTLPYWLLDRAMANTSTLATNVCYLFADGRFYGWEGINCCEGTCTHVWHYAQAPGRLFPQIERLLRERVDLGIGLHPDGAISSGPTGPTRLRSPSATARSF